MDKISRITTESISEFNESWEKIIKLIGIDESILISSSKYDPGRRVYMYGHNVIKITHLNYQTTMKERSQTLRGEFDILKLCRGITGLPEAISWEKVDLYEMLVMTNVSLGTLGTINSVSFVKYFLPLSRMIFRMSLRGVSHNDLTVDNLLVTEEGNLRLIDFDQATLSTVPKALARSFFNLKLGDAGISNNMPFFMKNKIKETLPQWALNLVRIVLRKKPAQKLPCLPEDASADLKTLLKAWECAQTSDASSPGISQAYYSLIYEEYEFPGERPWEQRWDILRLITNFKGKRILELGCNMSLLSCFLLREENIAAALAVDVDSDIIKSAKLVSTALGVQPSYKNINFDLDSCWEDDLLEFKADIVFVLNVLNWVQDKQRLLSFLGSFDQVIFEGHESYNIERERFVKLGFTEINLIGLTERNRPLIYSRK